MTTNHEHLRKVAEKATPGPWEKELYGRRYCVSRTDTRSNVCTSFGSHQPAEDADFIATFNPATAIALLDELAALRKENEGLRLDAERWRQFLKMVDPDKVPGGFTVYFAIEEGTDQLCYADDDIVEIVDAARAAIGDGHE